MLFWLCILLSIWPLLWLLRVLFAARLILGLEFRREKVIPIPADALASHLREAAEPWLTQLAPLGFQLIGGWQVQRTADGALDDFAIVMTHGAQPIRAVLRPHDSADRAGECWLGFRTTTAEGFEIVTASFAPEEIVPRPPGIQSEVVLTENASELLKHHEARVATAAGHAWRCGDIAGAALREQFLHDGVFAHLCASGLVAEREEESFSFHVGPAFKRAVFVMRAAARQKKQLQRAKKQAAALPPRVLSPETLVEFDWQQYRQIGAVMRGRMSGRVKAVITIVSFLAFAAALAWRMSPVVAISLVVALVVHEYGHLLGMRWFGFRDTQLLFIPFFGGAAVGHDDKVLPPWQHIVIILLGPMPGLFAGLAMLAYGSGGGAPEWWQEAAVTAVVMNAFNLLPILPLDGGQIVDFAIGTRFPRARVFFLGVSALALLVVALVLDGVAMLLGLAIMMLIRLPLEWKLAGVRRAVQGDFPAGGDERTIVRRLLLKMREAAWQKVSMVQRIQLARGLQNVLRTPRPGLGTMMFAMLGYTVPLWGGVPLAIWAAHREAQAQVAKAEQDARAAGLLARTPAAARGAVADEDNAAIPYAQAEALFRAAFKSGGWNAAPNPQIVELLRTAARKKTFVPSVAVEEKKAGWLGGLSRGLVVAQLTAEANERLRFREPVAAAELAVDALRLIRLLDDGAADWSWTLHQQNTNEAWRVIEGVFGSGATLPAELLAQLRALIDESHEIAFAVAAMPREALRQFGMIDAARESPELTGWMRMWSVIGGIATDVSGYRVKMIHDAIATHRALQQVAKGQWPAAAPVSTAAGDAGEEVSRFNDVSQLAEMIARLRQARAALAVAERKQSGAPAPTLEALGLDAAFLQHPFTRQPLRLERRGSLDVLAFVSRATGATANEAGAEMVWRLPP